MQKFKNTKQILSFLIVSLIFFGLFFPQNLIAKSEQSNYKIGVLVALSGLVGTFGVPQKNTLELLAEELNLKGGVDGRKIDLVFYDTQSLPDIAVRQVKKMLTLEKPDAIIGPTMSVSAKAVLPIVNAAKTPLIALAPFSDDNQSTHHWVFLTMQTHDIAIHKIYEDLKNRGGKKVAFLTSIDDEFARGGRRVMNKLAPEYGLKVLADETVNIRDTSYLSPLQKIKKTSPDAIIIWGLRDVGLSGRTISKLKIKSQVYHSHSVSALSYFFGTSLKYMEGDRVPANPMLIVSQLPDKHPQKELLANFVKKYEKRYQAAPIGLTANTFDAFGLLVHALKKAKTKNKEKIREALENTKGFVGAQGTYNFSSTDHLGLKTDSFYMVEIRDEKWKLVD